MAASKPVRSDLAMPTAFVLRTPLLPRDELDRWSAELASPTATDGELDLALARDRELLRARLRAIVLRPEVREAIFVASPNLCATVGRVHVARGDAATLLRQTVAGVLSRRRWTPRAAWSSSRRCCQRTPRRASCARASRPG